MSSNWQFEKKEVDDGTGWNSPVITGFKKNKLKSLTCEILQNSLDNPANEDGAVRVTFSQRVVAREQVPGAHDLESRLLRFWSKRQVAKVKMQRITSATMHQTRPDQLSANI